MNLGKSLTISMLYPQLQHKLIITDNSHETMRTKSANACLQESLFRRSAKEVLVTVMAVMMVLVLMMVVMVMVVVMMDIILY